MANARMGSLTTCALLLLFFARSHPVKLDRRTILWALSTALFDTSGNLLFVAATRVGRLDIAAVLASLYPASTILLAGFLLKEKADPPSDHGHGDRSGSCSAHLGIADDKSSIGLPPSRRHPERRSCRRPREDPALSWRLLSGNGMSQHNCRSPLGEDK